MPGTDPQPRSRTSRPNGNQSGASSRRRPPPSAVVVDRIAFDEVPDVEEAPAPPTEVVVAIPDEEPWIAAPTVPALDSVEAVPLVVRARVRGRKNRPRVRRVTRVVRHIDSWSVMKISVIFYATLYLILLVAGVLLWSVAVSTGTVGNVEHFIRDLFALDSFTFAGGKIFHASWIIGAFLVAGGTGLNVTMTVLFNLISDLVGGLRVTVLEEEVVLGNVVDEPPTEPGIVSGSPPGL
ncbi:MAG: DUF3566 domain-containing protein [Acidimicrobiales bacterium]